jgi:hypothetical protein
MSATTTHGPSAAPRSSQRERTPHGERPLRATTAPSVATACGSAPATHDLAYASASPIGAPHTRAARGWRSRRASPHNGGITVGSASSG